MLLLCRPGTVFCALPASPLTLRSCSRAICFGVWFDLFWTCETAAGSDVGADQQEPTSSPRISPARALLESIGLDIYVGAFEVSGYDTVESLQGLTHWDLDRIHRHSHVPILPNHRERILEASCRFSSLLVSQLVTLRRFPITHSYRRPVVPVRSAVELSTSGRFMSSHE